jgi:hypothetical protein
MNFFVPPDVTQLEASLEGERLRKQGRSIIEKYFS